MKVYEINKFGIEYLSVSERDEPVPLSNEVKIRIRAVSLNYRDLMIVEGTYNPKLKMPIVPFSDAAGEVVEVGAEVTKFKPGDRVMPIFMQGWIDGKIDHAKARTALGGDLDGVLREYATFSEEGLVLVPDHLSFEEAATLPCAAVTAFHALFESGGMRSDDTILLQGTGGVSIFALQFAAALGMRVIITSSSDEKLERARAFGATDLINYIEREDWDRAVLEMTDKQGVDHIVEVGGAGTLERSLRAIKMGGHIAVIGVLAGGGQTIGPVPIFMKSVKLQGIFVGSRKMFEDMNRMLLQHPHIKPAIDRVLAFEEVRAALNYMKSGAHFGKIVVRI